LRYRLAVSETTTTQQQQTNNIMNLNDLTFGIEIETAKAPRQITRGGYHHGAAVTFNNAPTFNGTPWKAERDSSIRSTTSGSACEFVSPVLKGEEGLQNVIDFVAWMNEQGCKVNSSCGIHIHVGVSSITSDAALAFNTVGKLVEAAKKYENGIYAQTGTARQAGGWCRRLTSEDKLNVDKAKRARTASDKRAELGGIGRYKVINLNNLFNNKNTAEFRAFAGTLNISKVLCHLATVFALTEFAYSRALTGKRIVWKDWNVSGSKSLGYIFKKMAPIFANSAILKAAKNKMRMWGMAMAAKWDNQNGATPEAGASAALLRVRRIRGTN
jgi:hypothetical protein